MKYAAFEQIKTQRLLLRKLRPADAEYYYNRLGGSEEVTRYMLWQPHASLEESRKSIDKVLRNYQKNSGYCWGIALQEDDSLIGRIDLLRFNEENDSCSFAYMLGEEFWNQGFGTEALRAVFAFAFENLQVQCIVADHMGANAASGKVMQKAGMHHVRTWPAKYEKCGKRYDAEEYRITFDEWKRGKETAGGSL